MGEWDIIITYLGNQSIAGGKLKETGNNIWLTPNTVATNSSGFTTLPGGYRLDISILWAQFVVFGVVQEAVHGAQTVLLPIA